MVAIAGSHKGLNRLDRLYAAAGAGGHAVHRCSGAGKIKLSCEGPVLQKPIDKAGVENISCTRRVDYVHAVGGRLVEPFTIPRQNTVMAQSRGAQAALEAAVHEAQRHFQIGFPGKATRHVPAHDEVIDVLQQVFDAGVKLIEIGNDRDAGSAGPDRCLRRSLCIVSIDVQCARLGDPCGLQMRSFQGNALISAAQYRTLATAVDQDERLRAGCFWHGDEMGFHSLAEKGFLVQGSVRLPVATSGTSEEWQARIRRSMLL